MSDLNARQSLELSQSARSDTRDTTGADQPHDLDDRLPGLAGLRDLTMGSADVTIVVLDGDPDLALSCFHEAPVSKHYPFWHPRAAPVTPEQHALYRQVSESGLNPDELTRQLSAAFPPQVLNRILGNRHATHITSTIVGRPGSPVPGIAPECRVIVVPLNEIGDPGEFMSALNLVRAVELARELDANIIHCAVCVPTGTDQPHELLARAVKACLDDNILIVAPAGNDGGDCRCIPAVLPGLLAVGALKDDGSPFQFSNWGGNYASEGIMAPGQNILCAQPCTEQPIREKGTSLSAPVVTAIAALLMSRQVQLGQGIDAASVRAALTGTARPCDPAVVKEPERCLRGVIDLPAAMERLFGLPGSIGPSSNLVRLFGDRAIVPLTSPAVESPGEPSSSLAGAASVTASTAHSGLVYAIGRLSYDLASDVGEQALRDGMARDVALGLLRGGNPNDNSDLIAYLDLHPLERRSVIWLLQVHGAPIYALQPTGPYADAIYEVLLHLLAGQILPEDVAEFVERVSIPARHTGRTVELLSRVKVPVISLTDLRGIFGWQINSLVRDAVTSVTTPGSGADDGALREAVANFLKRVYFELSNVGVTSRDRAMNFAATNCAQAASVFARALAERRVLEAIKVDKSPVCRLYSDCWELYLTFYDPEQGKRANRVFHFTIDVSDITPVTVGAPKSWTKRRYQ
ncbi:hypothetical protein BH11PSE4_BH11PSE4_36220 [soil metagenome]